MHETHYLIVGASHAALSALHAIRMVDSTRPVTMVSRDDALPYSPTALPYVVSGRSLPEKLPLKDDAYFAAESVAYLRGRTVARIDAADRRARLADGAEIRFEKLLLATGATPVVPPVPGLRDVPFHVLRTLDDAVRLRAAVAQARSAVVLGAGLIGMHAAENLSKAGVRVTVIERAPRVLPAYFDADAASLIERAFAAAGVAVRTGAEVMQARPSGSGSTLTLADGSEVTAELLLVGTGVAPVTDLLHGSGVECDRGVLVDDFMRTNVPHVWAAGDVAQAREFGAERKILNGVLPDAVEQGRIAGQSMAEDSEQRAYAGGVPLNTYTFFGNVALSVGIDDEDCESHVVFAPEQHRYLKIVLDDGRLKGIFSINVPFDAGIMWSLILRKVDLAPVKQRFLNAPQATARALMSKIWR